MRSLLIIRHCQSQHHLNGMTGGWTDTPLTDLGLRQAVTIASRLQKELDSTKYQLYSSDLKRAAQTAEIIGQAISLPVITTPELREFNNGLAAGLTQEEAKKIEIGEHIASVDRQPYPEAETWRRFYWRTEEFLERLATDSKGKTPILVTHGGTAINIIAWWLQMKVEMLTKVSFGVAPGGITELIINHHNERELKRLSDISHLEVVSRCQKIMC